MLAQALVQLPRRQHCPPGVILLSYGHTKHHREPLAGRQSEGAVVGLEDVLHQSHHRLEQAIPALWAQPCRQGGGVLQSPAEHSHQLVFRVQDKPRAGRQGRRGNRRRWERSLRWGRRDGAGRRLGHRHGGNEPIALPMHRRNVLRGLDRIPEHLAQLADAGGEHLLTDMHVRPHRGQHVRLAHQAAGVGHQGAQDRLCFGGEFTPLRAAPEAVVGTIEDKRAKVRGGDGLQRTSRAAAAAGSK
jgi:hypothetical protein